MKTAKLTVVAFDVECPYCFESIESPTGSLMWTTLDCDVTSGQKVICPSCDETFKLPNSVQDNKLPKKEMIHG